MPVLSNQVTDQDYAILRIFPPQWISALWAPNGHPVAVALGGDAAADVAVVRARPAVFGLVASDPTVLRLVARLAEDSEVALQAIAAARAVAAVKTFPINGQDHPRLESHG